MPRKVTEEENLRRMQAYEAEATDQAAAEVLHMKVQTFRGWRYARGLPQKGQPRLTSEEVMRRLDAYDVEPNDCAAARRLRMKTTAYHMWRVGMGLPAKAGRGRPRAVSFAEKQLATSPLHQAFVRMAAERGYGTSVRHAQRAVERVAIVEGPVLPTVGASEGELDSWGRRA